jgi:hypothetical protein
MFAASEPVGLVIEPETVRVVALAKTRGETVVSRFIEADIPSVAPGENRSDAVARVVADIFNSNSLSRERVVVAFNSSDLFLGRTSFPFQDESRIRMTVKFRIEEILPFPVEDCIADYRVLQTKEGKTDVSVAAAEKQRIAELLRVLELADVDPIAIELDLGALANVASWIAPGGRCSLLADVGTQTTKAVVHNDGVVSWRSFRTDSGSVAAASRNMALELRKTLFSSGLEGTPQGIYLTGSYRDLREMGAELGKAMEIETKLLPQLSEARVESPDVNWDNVCMRGATALGCALKAGGFDNSQINLRREQFAHRKKLEQLSTTLAIFLSILLACGILWNTLASVELRRTAEEEKKIYLNAMEWWKFAGQPENPPDTTPGVADRLQELTDAAKSANVNVSEVKHLVIEEWREWAERVPGDLGVVFNSIEMTQKTITIQGTAASATEAEQLKAAVNGPDGRFHFELPKTGMNREGRTSFTLTQQYAE